ncbi:7tm Odorant receptor [Nesidiocoris tenuis]|uniref:Odorant receptor n=1 Tax=Nesidiocoris tenuis TaxID=355587 RepID=A0ABN7BCN9_9HEMI|nr:7tm Odorant receptor [Nesidiocoris tenuis]
MSDTSIRQLKAGYAPRDRERAVPLVKKRFLDKIVNLLDRLHFWITLDATFAQVIRLVLIPSHGVFYATLIMATVNEFKHGSVISTVKSAFVSGPSSVAVFKLFVIVRHRKTLKDITNSMDSMMDGILSRRIHPDCERELKSRYRSCRRLYKVVVYFGCTVTTHATVTPLVATLINALLSDDPLPFESWPMFLVSYCWMAINTFCIGHVLYMFDATYFAMADNLQIHFAALKSYLENLDLTKNDEIDLTLCLKNHMELLRLCRMFRRICRKVIVTTRMLTMLLLCAGTFVLTSAGPEFTPNDRGNLLSTLIYIAAVFFNYCRCADNIAHQLDELNTDVYNAKWVDASASQKRSILNMMTISRMEPKFCGIASINLDTFVNVMRGVYSYYNFLTAVDITEPVAAPVEPAEELADTI